MHTPDLSREPYRRPPMSRATDPQRMNWLWRLICEVAELRAADVVEALHAAQVPVDQSRARSWIVSDRDDGFFPISIVEMERNLRSLLELRETLRENGELAVAEQGEARRDATMLAACQDDIEAADGGLEAADNDVAGPTSASRPP